MLISGLKHKIMIECVLHILQVKFLHLGLTGGLGEVDQQLILAGGLRWS